MNIGDIVKIKNTGEKKLVVGIVDKVEPQDSLTENFPNLEVTTYYRLAGYQVLFGVSEIEVSSAKNRRKA